MPRQAELHRYGQWLQFGQSEEILGDLLTGRRDDFVLATKFTFQTDPKAGILGTGSSRRSVVSSVEASLKQLKTDRIDLYWAHGSDGVTPLEEIVRGFDDLARAGKLPYAGVSDFPAWRRGATPIAGLQVEHSLRTHDGAGASAGLTGSWPRHCRLVAARRRRADRQIPFARKDRREGSAAGCSRRKTPPIAAVLDTLIAVAKDAGFTPAEISIAWVAGKGSLPIIGPRTLAQLENNLGAINVALSPEQIGRLDEVSAIPAAFPHRMLNNPETRQGYTGGKLEQFDAPAEPIA